MNIFLIGGKTVSSSDPVSGEQAVLLEATMGALGQEIVEKGHTLLVCSPFEGSADMEAVRGAAIARGGRSQPFVHYYIPDNPTIREELEALRSKIPGLCLQEFLSRGPADLENVESRSHAWLLAQLCALDRCHAVIAVGGKPTGPMSLLLPLAESRRKCIVPLRFLGGAAAECFERQRHFIQDRLGGNTHVLGEPAKIAEIVGLLESLVSDGIAPSAGRPAQRFFLSYPKARPEEADIVETTLRRRNFTVFRDERDFGAGHVLAQEIDQYLYQSEVFIALWCKEYACSPWCFDELEIALKLQSEGRLTIWILCLDETRVVPPKARHLVHYTAISRNELEGALIRLLERSQANYATQISAGHSQSVKQST